MKNPDPIRSSYNFIEYKINFLPYRLNNVPFLTINLNIFQCSSPIFKRVLMLLLIIKNPTFSILFSCFKCFMRYNNKLDELNGKPREK